MHIQPIRTDKDHAAALAEIERLWDAPRGSAEADHLAVLATLVAAYEDEHHPILPPSPIEAIEFRLDQLGLDRKALEPIIGSRARVAEVMNRRRGLSIGMIRRLHEKLDIPAEILIREAPPRSKPKARPRKTPRGRTVRAAHGR